MTVKINRTSGKAPQELVAALVAGQTFPFVVTLTHTNTFPLVVPSTGLNTTIAPNTPVSVKVKKADQAWVMITDLAELAHRADNDAEDFATIVAPVVASAVAEAQAPAVEEPAVASAKVTKAAAAVVAEVPATEEVAQ